MNKPKPFNKTTFTLFIARELSVSLESGARLYDKLAKECSEAIESGGSVRVFNLGTLKKVKKRWSDEERLRFRPAGYRKKMSASGAANDAEDEQEDD